jgi:hypothetical protein
MPLDVHQSSPSTSTCPWSCVLTGIAAPSAPSKKNGWRLMARCDLVQARQRMEATVLHHVDDAVELADVLRVPVAVDDDQVGQLAQLQRADGGVNVEVVRAV